MKLKKLYSFLTLLTAFLCLGTGNAWGSEMTVAGDATSCYSAQVPFYPSYADTQGTKSQVIYSKDLLTEMAGKNISALRYYASGNFTWGSGPKAGTVPTLTVRMKEVDDTSLSGFQTGLTEVYTGQPEGKDTKELYMEFDNSFAYSGTKNLLIEVEVTTSGGYCVVSFYNKGYASGTSYYHYSSSNSASFALPKTTFTYSSSAAITCPKPTELEYSNVTATSVDLDWTNGGSESSWNVLYKASGDADWSSIVASENPYTLSGLTPNSDYQVKVQAVCGVDDESGASNVVSFPTPCADLVAPFEAITFAGLSNNTNVACWDNTASTCFSNPAGTTQKYYVWGVFIYSGNEVLRMNNFNTRAGSALINTPNIIIPNDGKEYELVFDYIHSSSQGDPFYIKVSENDGASFSDLKSFAKNSSTNYDAAVGFTEGSVSLAGYNNKTIILQFYATADYGNGAIFLDNVRVKASSSCVKPSGLSYDPATLGSNSVDLSWTAGASETAWNVRYMADGDADWTVIPADDNDGFTVSGLSDNTHYTMQVQADCGSEVVSEWNSTAIDFTTKCNAFAMPFTQTFDGLTAGIPDCWDNSEGTTTEADYKWNYFATGYDGKCVRFEALYNANGNDNYLKTPSITISAAARLSFRYKNPKGAALSVYYAIDGGSKTVLQSSFDTKTSWSDKVEIDLPAACEGHAVEIFFKGVSNCSYGDAYIYLDEVSVKAQPTCFAPTGLGYSAVTAEGATLSWTVGKEGDNAWVAEYSKNSDFSSSSSVAATTNPFTLTGLDEQSTYYVRVKTKCGESEYSEVSDAINFTTKCAAIVLNSLNPSWEENFDDETNETVVACWDNSASTCFSNPAGSTPAKYVWGVIRTGSYGDYKYSIYMRNFNVRAGTALINTPSFTLPSDKNYEFTFKCNHLASCDPLVIKISVNGGEFAAIDGASYTNTSGTNSYSDPGTLIEQSIDLSAYKGKTITLQFFTTANYGDGAIWVDDLSIHQAPTCFKPTLGDATAQTPEGATFSWTASSHGETQWQWKTSKEGSDWSEPTSATSVTVTGHAASTAYTFYVRSYCDADDQSDAASKSFTTAAVTAPTAVSVGSISTTGATATWTAGNVADYQWCVVASGAAATWDQSTTSTSATLSGLTANTAYDFYVRSYCAGNGAYAAASKVTFTTACEAETVDATHPFTETFNGISSGIPACWNNDEGSTTTASYKWNSATGGQDDRCVRFDSRNNGNNKTNVLASPTFELDCDADLVFYVKNYKGGEYAVQISVDGGVRQNLFTGLTNIQNWTKKEVVLTNYVGKKIQFFFCGTSNYSESSNGYLYLDEFQIVPVTCRKPASRPVASDVDDQNATLTWTAGGANTDYQFALALAGEDPVWDAENVVSALTKSFDNLTPITSYDFYVRTYCDEDHQSDTLKVSFKTDCADYVTLPFEENFNSLSADAIPECWDNAEGTSTDYYKWKAVTYSGHNTTTCVRFNSSTNDADATNVLATPAILLGEGNLLTFWAKNPTGGDFKVQIKEEGEAAVDLLTTGLTSLADWTLKYVAIPAAYNNKKVQILFHATSNEGDANAYIYIDDVRVTRGEAFADGVSDGVQTRLGGLEGETLDFVMTRPMQYNGYYNTLCLPFSVSESEMAETEHPFYNCTVKAFDYAVVAGEELQLAITAASGIEAGVPCFVKYDGAAIADKTVLLFKDVTISASAPSNKADNGVTYQGIFNTITATAESEDDHQPSCLFVGGENALYWPTTAKKMNAFRAYFSISYGGSANAPIKHGMRARIVERAEVATGCENINAADTAVKLLENGQVIIIRNGVKYTIQGQIISK